MPQNMSNSTKINRTGVRNAFSQIIFDALLFFYFIHIHRHVVSVRLYMSMSCIWDIVHGA